MLKINEGATVDKQLTLTQSMLDDAKARINELETDNRYFLFIIFFIRKVDIYVLNYFSSYNL